MYDADLRPALRLLHRHQVRGARRDLAAAMRRLIERRHEDPLAGLPVVTAREVLEFAELPDAANTRPPDLIDRYPRGLTEYHHAMDRLTAAGLRHNTKENA